MGLGDTVLAFLDELVALIPVPLQAIQVEGASEAYRGIDERPAESIAFGITFPYRLSGPAALHG